MKRLLPILFLGISCAPMIVPTRLPEPPMVRVLILENRDSLSFSSDSPFSVKVKGGVRKESPGTRWRIEVGDTGVTPWDTTHPTGLTVMINDSLRVSEPSPPIYVALDSAGSILIGDRPYRGDIKISWGENRKLRVINILPLEDYLLGVVPCEIGTIDPKIFEAMKAQAVAARSYALRRLQRRWGGEFDLYGSSRDQVYGGIDAETPLGNSAVLETKGEVGIFKGEIIEAMYHSTCGGVTADASKVFNSPEIPYLRGISDVPFHWFWWFWKRPEPFCVSSPHFFWSRIISKKDFFAPIIKLLEINPGFSGPPIGDLKIVEKKEESIRPLEWDVIDNKGKVTISSVTLRRFFNLPSHYFDFEIRGDKVIIKGHGYGHGVGMCQCGAMEMARRGYNYKKILHHYYRGIRIHRIY